MPVFSGPLSCPDSVRRADVSNSQATSAVQPLRLLGPDRILEVLALAESQEINPHFRDDYRQTFIALSRFWRDEFPTFRDAFVATSYAMYGIHPDKLHEHITAKRRAKLGAEYSDWYDESGQLISDRRRAMLGPEATPLRTRSDSAEARPAGWSEEQTGASVPKKPSTSIPAVIQREEA